MYSERWVFFKELLAEYNCLLQLNATCMRAVTVNQNQYHNRELNDTNKLSRAERDCRFEFPVGSLIQGTPLI